MNFRFLLALPFICSAAYLVGDLLLFGSAAYGTFVRVDIELVKALAVIGSLAAALTLKPGEYLRRAWLFTGGSMLLLLIRDATLALEAVPLVSIYLNGLLVVLGNVFSVIGIFMLARAWKVAGLELLGPRWASWAVVAVMIIVALLLGGPSVVLNFKLLLNGELEGLVGLASSLGDTISLFLIAPLLLTALALRGGMLGWPWSFITACCATWMLYNTVYVMLPIFGADSRTVDTVTEALRTMACMFQFSAGIAQRLVIKLARRRFS